MKDGDRISRLVDRAVEAEALAGRLQRQIEWLAERLAKELGSASWEDGSRICYDLPEEMRDGLCPFHKCAECWAGLAESEVNGLEYYLKPECRPEGETDEECVDRRQREAGAQVRGRVIDFGTGRLKGEARP